MRLQCGAEVVAWMMLATYAPPTVLGHTSLGVENNAKSHITTLEVYLRHTVAHLKRIIITVSNLHCSVARTGGDFPNTQEYYDMLFEHFVNYGPLLLATDAGMSLLETRTM